MTIATSSFTATITRFFGVNVNPQTDVEKAIGEAHSRTARRDAAADASLFGKPFLMTTGTPIVAAFLDGKRSRHATAVALANAWTVDLGPISSRERKWRTADTAMIADTFLTELIISVRRKYHGGNLTGLPLVGIVGKFPPGFTMLLDR